MQRIRLSLLACVLSCLLIPAAAHAFELQLLNKPLRIDLTETFIGHARPWDPGNSDAVKAYYHDIANRLNVQASWNHITIGVRLDSNAYFHTPQVGDGLTNGSCSGEFDEPPDCRVTPSSLQNRFKNSWADRNPLPVGVTGVVPVPKVFEKMFISYTHEKFDATLGDAYANLGRGLVLSLRKVDQLSTDTTLLGAKGAFHVGDFSGTLLMGRTNIQNVDDVEARYIPDPDDFIAGGRLDYRIANKVSVGVEGVWGDQPNGAITEQRDRHTRVGVVIDAPRPLPWLSIYGEYVRAFENTDAVSQEGVATYLSANVLAGITSWLFEFKDYRNFQPWHPSSTITNSVTYAAPPTLERVLVPIIDDSNTIAGRLKADVRAADWVSFYISPELGQLHPNPGERHALADVYAGAEFRWNDGLSHAFPIIETRREWNQAGPLVESLQAFEIDAAQSLVKAWSLEFQGLLWLRDRPSESRPWQEGTAYLGVKWAPKLFASVGFEFTTEDKFLKDQHDFVNGQVQWEITPATSITLFAGGRRPGLRCISGVCRNFPAFQGLELSIVARG